MSRCRIGFGWLLAAGLLIAGCTGVTEGVALRESDSSMAATGSNTDQQSANDPGSAQSPSGVSGTEGQTSNLPAAPVSPVFESVPVPAELQSPGTRLTAVGLVSATVSAPVLMAAVQTEPATLSTLMTWSSGADGNWTPSPISVGVPGSVESSAIAADESLTAIVGTAWESGNYTSFLLVSQNRIDWTPVDLELNAGLVRLSAVAVIDGKVQAFGRNDDGDVVAITVDGANVSTFVLVDLKVEDSMSVAGVAGHGAEASVVVAVGSYGAQQFSIYHSVDAGTTWSLAGTFDVPGSALIAGLVWTGTQYLATGAVPDGTNTEQALRPTAWSSADGLAFVGEAVTFSADSSYLDDIRDAGLSAPVAAYGRVLALAWSDGAVRNLAMERSADGSWREVGRTAPFQSVGAGGFIALPFQAQPATEQPLTFLTAGLGGYAVQTNWFDPARPDLAPTVLGSSDYSTYISSVSVGTDQLSLTASKWQLDIGPDDGWASYYATSEFGFSADGFVLTPPDPPDALGSIALERAFDGDAEVLLTSKWAADRSKIVVAGWFRESPTAPWRPVSGFGANAAELVEDVARIGDLWVATLSVGTTSGVGRQTRTWSSADGVSWTPTVGEFSIDQGGSSISSGCTLADGRPVLVGAIEVSEDIWQAATWVYDGSTWLRSQPPSGTSSSYQDCATNDGVTTVTGDVDGVTVSWTTTDGLALVEQNRLPGTESRSGTRAAEGGFTSFGYLNGSDYTGAVIWISADGIDWDWVPIPTTNDSRSGVVASVGSAVLVTVQTVAGQEAWVLTNLEELLTGR